MGKTKPMAKCSGDGNPFRKEPMGVCMCACVCMSYVCMCACWGIFVTLMAFISGQWNAAKTFFLLSCCSYTHTPMNAHSTYIPYKKKPVIPAVCPSNGSSSVLIQYLHFFFKIQEKAQMYPGECEKMQSSFLPSVSAPSKASKEPWKRRACGSLGSWEWNEEFIPGSGPAGGAAETLPGRRGRVQSWGSRWEGGRERDSCGRFTSLEKVLPAAGMSS